MDLQITGQSAKIRALSAAVPHVNIQYQKKLAIAVKMMEIKEICKFYDSYEKKYTQNPHWRQDLINAILPHLNEKKQNTLRAMVQIMEMQDVMANFEAFKEMTGCK